MLFGDLIATAAGVLVIRILVAYQLRQMQLLTYLLYLLPFIPLVLFYVLYWVYPNLVPIHLEVVA